MPSTLHQPHKLLFDVISAAEAIGTFIEGRSRDEYLSDLMLRSAVERQFEIVGEALRRLQILDQSLAKLITDYRRIIDFRNLIAHGYDVVEADAVWQFATRNRKVLLQDVRVLLANLGQADQ